MVTHRFFRTAAFRLALLYAGVFSISTLLLFAFLYWRVGTYGVEQMRAAIDAEIGVMLDEERRGVLLAEVVGKRASSAESRSSYYLLQDAAGRRLAGNIAPLPATPGLYEYRVSPLQGGPGASAPELALVRGAALDSGNFIAIGRNLSDLEDLNRVVLRALIGAVLVTAALALLGGLVISAGFLRRVEAIATTSATIMEGKLNQRIPQDGSGDELDRLALSLNRMLDRIQHLMDGMRQVSTDIAHDLRTPIARLRQRLEKLAQRRSRLDPEASSEIEAALDEVDGILATFSALLRISQIESGSRRSGFRPVDASALFETLAEAYVPVAEDAGRRLLSNVAPGISVVGDRELLAQMIANLLENALRHAPEGSTIELTLKRAGNGSALGTVADDGPGIPEGERANVLRRFYRLERNRTSAGNGLGLSLVAAVADLHGIELRLLDNAPGLRVELRF